MGGWVCVAEIAGELKWNSQICWPPTWPRVPFTQPSILFRLAIGRLHVSPIVELFVCAIRRDSLILLGSRGSDHFADAAEKKEFFFVFVPEGNSFLLLGLLSDAGPLHTEPLYYCAIVTIILLLLLLLLPLYDCIFN